MPLAWAFMTFSQKAPVVNFKSFYQVGFPVGVNVWKTAKIGYSQEIVPFIQSEAGVSRVNNVLFHPGVLVGLGNGFTLANRQRPLDKHCAWLLVWRCLLTGVYSINGRSR